MILFTFITLITLVAIFIVISQNKNLDRTGCVIAGILVCGYLFVQGILLLMIIFGLDILTALTPTLIIAAVWLYCKKKLPFRIASITIAAIILFNFAPESIFNRGIRTFTEMPAQRLENQGTLQESVLILNPPANGEPLRDVLIEYFDQQVEEEDIESYTYRSINFYYNTSYTREFINNKLYPYDLGRTYLADDETNYLGQVWIKADSLKRIKCVRYRMDHSAHTQTDTLSIAVISYK